MDADEVKHWRRAERERLIGLRQAAPPDERRRWSERITVALGGILADRPGILGVYWPFRAEFDPRPLIDAELAAGREVALPVVVDKRGPLEYRLWRPGEPLVDGVWNIPVPEHGRVVRPAVVLAPVVGFDRECYRLGYGGGYFDRTLGSMVPRPVPIGVGFGFQAIATIYPQPFDIPMELVVTEAGVQRR
jgi:5-formyltetrahydrofolate cyclo-ligase